MLSAEPTEVGGVAFRRDSTISQFLAHTMIHHASCTIWAVGSWSSAHKAVCMATWLIVEQAIALTDAQIISRGSLDVHKADNCKPNRHPGRESS